MSDDIHTPGSSMDWRILQDEADKWVVQNTGSGFIAHPMDTSLAPAMVHYEEHEGMEARRWLRKEARRDRDNLIPCDTCGHLIFEKLPSAPFCCDACAKFEPPV